MDIYEYLKLDHAHVDKLFKQFEKTENKIRRVQIVTMIAQELLVHAKSEEETFYELLKKNSRDQEKILHAEKEHDEIKEQIGIVLNTEKVNSEWVKQVQKLKDLVTHHVKEEEGEIFDKAKKVLSDTEAKICKEQMHYLKQKYLRKLEKAEQSKTSITSQEKISL